MEHNLTFFTEKDFGRLLREVLSEERPKELLITSPWITSAGLRELEAALEGVKDGLKNFKVVLRVQQVSDLDITPPEAFRRLRQLFPGVQIRISNRVHAKMVIGEPPFAFISSSNITGGGFGGNLEAGVLVRERNIVEDARKHFSAIWEESTPIEQVLGVVMNPSKPGSVEIALFREVPQDSWVRVEMEGEGWLLARVDTVMRWNRSFFLNPFTQGEVRYFQSVDEFFKTFEISGQEALDWHIARSQALVGLTPDMLVATARVMAHMRGGVAETPRLAPPVGSVVKEISKGDFVLAFYKDKEDENSPFSEPYALGTAITPGEESLPFYLDFEEIMGKHMAVHGATGSGKSFFAKLFVSKVWKWITENGLPYSIVIVDPHGEYDPEEAEKRGDLEKVEFPMEEAVVIRPTGWPPELEEDIEIWRMWRDTLKLIREYESVATDFSKERTGKGELVPSSKDKWNDFLGTIAKVLQIEYGGRGEGGQLKAELENLYAMYQQGAINLDQLKQLTKERLVKALGERVNLLEDSQKFALERIENLREPEIQAKASQNVSEILEGSFDIKLSGDSAEARKNKALFEYLSSKYGEQGAAAYLLAKKFGLEEEVRARLEGDGDPLEPIEEYISENLRKREEYLQELKDKVKEKVKGLLNEGSFVVVNLKGLGSAAERAEIAAAVMETAFSWTKANEGRRVLLVLDEAHNFAGSAHGELSKGRENKALMWARRIATEGRKFGLGMVLVSQRVKEALDNTVRSQCNTVVLFRLINYNDISGAEESYEGVTLEIKEKLPTLQTGEAFVSGVGVKYPMLVKVKSRV